MSQTASVSGTDASVVGRSRWTNILPIVFVMYTIAYFDRANIGIALPFISKDLGLTATQGGLVAGVFAWGYTVTQLLAGFLTLRLGSRNVIGIALLFWGAGAIGTGFVRNFEELVALRIVLGLFEGPVFAACAILLSQWFMKPERGRAFGIWNLSSPLGAFLAGPISGFILAHYDWRVMMVVEGLPAWIWAVLWWWRIPASLDKAAWLPPAERAHVQASLAEEQAQLTPVKPAPWYAVLGEPAVWFTFLGFSLINILIIGFTTWLPSILKGVEGLSVQWIGILSGLPFLASMAGVYWITQHSDKHGQERRLHSAVPTMLTGIVMTAAALIPAGLWWLQVAMFVVVGFTMKMFLPLVFARLTEMFSKDKAIPAVAVISALGNLIGGFGGPVIIGYLRQINTDYTVPLLFLGGASFLGGICFLLVNTKRPGPATLDVPNTARG